MSQRWPVELRLKQAEKLLEVSFDDGQRFRLPAEYLRVESPSAEVQGHGAGQKQPVAGCARSASAGSSRWAITPSGWSSTIGHDTGIYSWAYLYQLGQEQAKRWAAYTTALAKAGLSREKR